MLNSIWNLQVGTSISWISRGGLDNHADDLLVVGGGRGGRCSVTREKCVRACVCLVLSAGRLAQKNKTKLFIIQERW